MAFLLTWRTARMRLIFRGQGRSLVIEIAIIKARDGGGSMKISIRMACALAAISLGAAPAWPDGTNIMRSPGDWRGTLLEGADALVATNSFGEPLFVRSGETIGPLFAPAAVSGDRLAAEFKRLCLDTGFDEAKLAAATGSSTFSLTNRKIRISPEKGGATPYEASVWYSPEARVQIWTGDLGALKNRETLSRWRKGATSSPFNASRVFAPACNVTVMATDFHDPQAFLAAMTSIVGALPKKAVTKPEWADGFWSVANADGSETRIVYSMVDFDKSEQLLHVGIARLQKK